MDINKKCLLTNIYIQRKWTQTNQLLFEFKSFDKLSYYKNANTANFLLFLKELDYWSLQT